MAQQLVARYHAIALPNQIQEQVEGLGLDRN
jgi:hypothetical protein